jgi:hypothetical protein
VVKEPVKRLFPTLRRVRERNEPRVGGTLPINILFCNISDLNLVRLPIVDGIAPPNIFEWIAITVKEVNDPIEFGILPVRLLELRDIDTMTPEVHEIPVQGVVHRDEVEGQLHPFKPIAPTLVAAIKSQRKVDSKVEYVMVGDGVGVG